jgi:hypothetical protein
MHNPFVTLLAWRVATHHPKGWAMRHWTAWICVESHVRERAVRFARADEKMRARRVAVVLLVVLTAGCAILESRAKEDAPTNVNVSDISAGYALLYDLVSKEQQSSLLSIIKKESPELQSLLERISDTSKTTAKELDALARITPPLNLKITHLPKIERAARESIDKETSKEILNSQGVTLEFNMVSSQLAAMNYAAHLARSLALVETNPRRKEFLLRTDRTFSELHSQVYKMLLTRYQR